MNSASLKLALALTLVCVNGLGVAGSIEWDLRGDSGLLEEVRAMAGKPHDSAEARGVRQLLNQLRLEIDATHVRKHVRRVWYFHDAEALRDFGTEIVDFDEVSQSLRMNIVSVLKPDGLAVTFDPKNAQIIDSDRYNVFSHDKQLMLPLPSLEKGGIAIIDYEVVTDKRKQESAWSDILFSQNLFPIDRFRLNVSWRENTKLNWSSTGGLVDCLEKDVGLSCTGSGIPAAQPDKSVMWRDVLGQIVLSEASSWEAIIGAAATAFASANRDVRGVDTLMKSLIESSQTKEQQISVAHEFVSRDIRYVANSQNGHAVTPHKIADTLANRYGDCKDKSALLAELLRRVGVEPYPVLVATNRGDPSMLKTPAMSYFNHIVICMDGDGGLKCLDPTDLYTDAGTLTAGLQGKVALRLKPEHEPELLQPATHRWRMFIETTFVLTEDGGAREDLTRKYFGEYAGLIRANLAGKSDEETSRYWLDGYHGTVSKQVDPIFKSSGVADMGPRLTVNSTVSYPPFADIADRLALTEPESWLRAEINDLYLKNKYHDAQVAGAEVQSKYHIDVSSHWKLASGDASLDLVHRFGSLTRTVERIGEEQILFDTRLLIPARTVNAEDIDEFNEFLDLLKREAELSVYGNPKN